MIEVRGRDTYHIKAALRALGGTPRKEPQGWVWLFPNDKEETVKLLLIETGVSADIRFVPDADDAA